MLAWNFPGLVWNTSEGHQCLTKPTHTPTLNHPSFAHESYHWATTRQQTSYATPSYSLIPSTVADERGYISLPPLDPLTGCSLDRFIARTWISGLPPSPSLGSHGTTANSSTDKTPPMPSLGGCVGGLAEVSTPAAAVAPVAWGG
eukprot:scaffold96613_cov18-Tisochrysis_lutea.AAC.1